MPRKTREGRAKYQREYRARIKQDVGLLNEAELERQIEEYKQKGLDRDDLFMDTVYNLAMTSMNAKYAELYWKMKQPTAGGERANWTAHEYAMYARIMMREVRRTAQEEGYSYAFDKDEIIGLLEWAKSLGIIDKYVWPKEIGRKVMPYSEGAQMFYKQALGFYEKVNEGEIPMPTREELREKEDESGHRRETSQKGA